MEESFIVIKTTIQGTHMNQRVHKNLNLGKFQTCVSACPNFASAQLALQLQGFLPKQQPLVAEGSTVNSS
jgi:hypothetical protein